MSDAAYIGCAHCKHALVREQREVGTKAAWHRLGCRKLGGLPIISARSPAGTCGPKAGLFETKKVPNDTL